MSDYYILITDAGAAMESAAHASGTPVELSEFGICDGGVEFIPDPTKTTFENEVFRGPISSLTVSSDDPTVLVAQCIIPAESGGYTIRGMAIYALDGTLYATGNYAEQQKPAPDSGFAVSLEILAQLAVSDTSDITLTVTEGAYLTEPQADTLYLRQDNQLAEIAAQGSEAQQESRNNLGLGSMATQPSDAYVPTSGGYVSWLQIGAVGNATLWIGDNDSGLVSAVDGQVQLYANGVNVGNWSAQGFTFNKQIVSTENIIAGLGVYESNGGVRVYSSNNPPPATAGDSYSDTMLGAMRWQDYGGGADVIGWQGELLCGLKEDPGDNEIHGYFFKPVQKNVWGAWYTVAG